MPIPSFPIMNVANDRQIIAERRAPLDLNADPINEPGKIINST